MVRRLFLILFLLVLLFVIFWFLFRKEKKEIDSIEEIVYSHSNGRSHIVYHLNCGDTCTLNVIPSWMDDEGVVVDVDSDTVNQILRILKDNNVSSWDGFDKSDSHVLDGDDFAFQVVMKNHKKIYAKGYMKYPKNYRAVISELTNIFNKICDQNFLLLFEHDSLKEFSFDNISKVLIEKYTEDGLETEEYTDPEKMKNIYNQWKGVQIVKETDMSCVDNTTIYRFVMKDGNEYSIEKECNWIVLNQKRYYYKEYPFS